MNLVLIPPIDPNDDYLNSLATEYLGSLAMPLLDVNTCICFNSLSNLAFYYT